MPRQRSLLEGNLFGAWAQNQSSWTCVFSSCFSHLISLWCWSTVFHYLIPFCLQDQAYFIYYFSVWSGLKMNLFTSDMWIQANLSVQNCNFAFMKIIDVFSISIREAVYFLSSLPPPLCLCSLAYTCELLQVDWTGWKIMKEKVSFWSFIIYPPRKIKSLFILFSLFLCLFNIIKCKIHWVHKHYRIWNAK